MILLADENVDSEIVERLRKDGHRVWYVAEMEPGISDEAVMELANKEKAVLLTADKDFGELIFRQKRVTQGVILIRLAGLPADKKAGAVAFAVNKHPAEFIKAFSVISPGTIRIRHEQQ